MHLQTHFAGDAGYTPLVAPGEAPVKLLTFGMVRLTPGERYEAQSAGDEIGLIILSGIIDLRVGDQLFSGLGGRASVFDGRGTGAYIPRGTTFTIHAAATPVEIALCRTPALADHPVQVNQPDQVVVLEVGSSGYRRYVHTILGVTNSQASQLIVGETYTVAGNWSSFPPHKHDTYLSGIEACQEELYLYKIRPAAGFGLQWLYTRPDSSFAALNTALAVRENDVTVMPYGYHPVAAPPGYDVYYLWFMAGTPREMRPHDDPAHAWIKADQAETRTYPR